MEKWLKIPDEQRDQDWEQGFLTDLLKSEIKLVEEHAISGPDGFPYFLIETEGGGEPFSKVVDWLTRKGIGLVINANREPYPDLVLTYGMIWSLHRYGSTAMRGYEFGDDFQAGEPAEEVLPSMVRKLLKQFFNDNGVLGLKFLLASRKEGLELCFSLESLGNPPEKEYEGIAEAISWFLPTNIGVTLASEKSMQGFVLV